MKKGLLITKRIAALLSCIILAFPSIGVYASEDKATAKKESEISQIDSFRGYAWGTSSEDVRKEEITTEMKSGTDYQSNILSSESKLSTLTIYNRQIDKYDASVEYLFLDNQLVCGGYEITIDDSNYSDICAGITEKYGDPYIEKPTIGWGRCSIWIDDEKNAIMASEAIGLIYFQNNDTIIDFLADNIQKFHGIDIKNNFQETPSSVGY